VSYSKKDGRTGRIEQFRPKGAAQGLKDVTERQALLKALSENGGDIGRTAKMLGLAPQSLLAALKQHGIRDVM